MGKEVILRILFCLESFQMMSNGERKFLLFFFSSVNYRRIYSVHLKNLRFAEDVLFYPKNEVMAFPKIKIKWNWVSDVHVYIKSNAVILILTISSCENPSNIWESNYGPQMYGANELTGRMEMVLQRDEWI